jgi:hypothetical protein
VTFLRAGLPLYADDIEAAGLPSLVDITNVALAELVITFFFPKGKDNIPPDQMPSLTYRLAYKIARFWPLHLLRQ